MWGSRPAPGLGRAPGSDTAARASGAPSREDWLRATDASPVKPFQGIQWSLSFAALLVYLFVIVTYQLRIGDFVMALALIGLVFEKKGIRVPGLLIMLTLWLLWALLGWLASPWSALVYERIEVLWKLTLITLVAVAALNDRNRIRIFILAFVLFFALYPARGTLFNYFIGGYSIFGRAIWNFIYRNPNDLAALTLLQLSMAAGLLVTERNKLFRRAALVAVVTLAIVILLTQSRGVFIGLVGFGVLALAGEQRRARAIAVGGVIALTAVLLLPGDAWDRFGALGTLGTSGTEAFETMDDQGSAEQRFEIWKTAVRIIQDNIFTGTGMGTYGEANALYSPNLGARDTHSTYLNVLAETGAPGLLIFFGMIAAAVIPTERVRRRIKKLQPRSAQQLYFLELGLLGFMLAGVFASYAHLTFLYLHLAIMWGLATAHATELRQAQSPSPTRRWR